MSEANVIKISERERLKLNLVIYFLLGFFLHYFGLLIAGLWLKFKAKTNRKNKLIALLLGLGAYLFYTIILAPYVLQPIIQPQIDKAFFEQNPDAGEVTQILQQKYPDAKIFVRIDQNTLYTSGTSTTTTLFTVQYRSTKELLTAKQMQNIAKQTCSILKSRGKTYDKVLIFSLKYTLPLQLAEIHRGIQKPCMEWETKDFSNVEFPI